jgi:hypothetical protein
MKKLLLLVVSICAIFASVFYVRHEVYTCEGQISRGPHKATNGSLFLKFSFYTPLARAWVDKNKDIGLLRRFFSDQISVGELLVESPPPNVSIQNFSRVTDLGDGYLIWDEDSLKGRFSTLTNGVQLSWAGGGFFFEGICKNKD